MTGDGTTQVVVLPTADLVARTTAERLLLAIVDAQSVTRPVHVVLTGGGLGTATLTAVRTSHVRDAVDWSGVHLWWGDERFLPTGDPERNETQARHALLDHLDLPDAHVHPVPGPDRVTSPEVAAERYAADLATFATRPGRVVPSFAVLLLGVGPDGHVASLFPGHPATARHAGHTAVAVHDSPKPPAVRVSLTIPAICSATQVWLLAAGAEKAAAVADGVAGGDVPAGGVHGVERTLWLLDIPAAGGGAA